MDGWSDYDEVIRECGKEERKLESEAGEVRCN